MHTILRFEAREVRSITIQMVHELELKRRSYGRLKTTAQSWAEISQPKAHFAAAKWDAKPTFGTRVPFCSPELLITFKALSSWPRFINVNHFLELFIISRGLSSWPKVAHVIHSPEVIITSIALSWWPEVVLVNHSPKLFIASKALSWRLRRAHVLFEP